MISDASGKCTPHTITPRHLCRPREATSASAGRGNNQRHIRSTLALLWVSWVDVRDSGNMTDLQRPGDKFLKADLPSTTYLDCRNGFWHGLFQLYGWIFQNAIRYYMAIVQFILSPSPTLLLSIRLYFSLELCGWTLNVKIGGCYVHSN